MLDAADLILTVFAPIVAQLIVDESTKKAYGELKKLIKDRLKGRTEADLVDGEKPEDWEEKLKKALNEVLIDRDMEIIKKTQEFLVQIYPERAEKNEFNVRISGNIPDSVTVIFQSGEQHAVPFLVPPQPPYHIAGRDDLLKELKQQLFDGGYLALHGLPGVGKTALAVKLAHDLDVLNHFPDGVLWAGLGREADIYSHLGDWAGALGISSDEIANLTSIEDMAKTVRAAIGIRQMLLVVDDVWEIKTAKYFKLGSKCAYLITTRKSQVALHFASRKGTKNVKELNEADGLKLLAQFVPEVVEDEPDEARKLVQAVGGLPLAITLLGSYLLVETYDNQPRRMYEAFEELRKTKNRLEIEQDQGFHPSLHANVPLSLMAAIDMSYEALDEPLRRTLLALSAFPPKPNTFPEEAALEVSDKSAKSLGKLTNHGLLESSGLGRYTLHQTIADYARVNLADDIQYKQRVYERMADFFASYVEKHERDYEALSLESSNIFTALQVAADQRMNKVLVRGMNPFYRFMEARGLYEMGESYLNQTKEAAESLDDDAGLAATLLNLGRLTEKRGKSVQAEKYYKKGLDRAYEIKDFRLISDLLRNLGVLLSKRWDLIKADNCLRKGLYLARKIKDPRLISDHLQSLGILENKRKNLEKAEKNLKIGLKLARKYNYLTRVSGLLVSLGYLEKDRGNFEQAKKYNEEGLELARKMRDRRRISSFLVTMGDLELKLNNYETAEQYSLEGLKLVCEMGYYERIETFLANLSSSINRHGKIHQIEQYLLKGLKLAYEVQDPKKINKLIEDVKALVYNRGNIHQAEQYFLEGLELACKINDLKKISSLLQSIGVLERDSEDPQQIENHLQKGLETSQKTDYEWLTCSILNECGKWCLNQEKLGSASEAFRKALEIARKTGLQESTAAALYGLAQVAAANRNMAEAHRYGQESLSIFEDMAYERTDEVKQWLASLV